MEYQRHPLRYKWYLLEVDIVGPIGVCHGGVDSNEGGVLIIDSLTSTRKTCGMVGYFRRNHLGYITANWWKQVIWGDTHGYRRVM